MLGQYEDEELGGRYYNRFRYYESNSGTYISKDPIGLLSGQPNFYAYVKDTNTWVDLLGLEGATTPIGELRSAGLKDAHYVIQDAAIRDYQNTIPIKHLAFS
ncbi:hypothetical protein DKK70_09885 [Gilliamella apicola]|uniref:RHS repeat-associated core domain-containing protein n=1 Tax=Gilliamella apicola TaxID=1196095 RepID=A0A2V4E3X0_9GAMM|nr:hypothetical protein DKK70_09885 [Gilliamella apicola]